MAISAEDIVDIVNSTLRDLGRFKITEITTDLQEHIAMSQLMRKSRVNFDSGRAIQFNVLTDPDDNSRNVGLFDVDNLNQKDGTTTGTVPWRHTVSGAPIDRRQMSMNRDPAKIVDFIKEKRYQQMIGHAELMETNFWDEPDSSTDATTPFGLKYWLTFNATTGFNGGNNTNFSGGPAAIDRDTFTRWKNYTFQYTAISKTDLIRKCGHIPRFHQAQQGRELQQTRHIGRTDLVQEGTDGDSAACKLRHQIHQLTGPR